MFVLPGLAGNVSLAKMPAGQSQHGGSSSRAASGTGRASSSGREGLRLRHQAMSEQGQPPQPPQQQQQPQPPLQQLQQQWALKATCTCKLNQQVRLQIHAKQLPALLQAVQLLQASLKQLKAQQHEAAAQAAAVAATARRSDSCGAADQLPDSSLSPAASLSSLPRPDTPSLATPCMSPSPKPPATPDAAASAGPAESATGPRGDKESTPATAVEDPSGLKGLATFGSGMLQRLPSKLLFGSNGSDLDGAHLGLIAELSITAEAGVGLEVTDSSGDVLCRFTMQELDAGASAEWSPAVASTSSTRRSSLQQQEPQPTPPPGSKAAMQLSAHAMLQQLSLCVAACAAPPAASGKSSGGHGCAAMHKLVVLDSASLQISSSEAEDGVPQPEADPTASVGRPPLPVQLSVLAGQLQVAASLAVLQPVLVLAGQLYQPPARRHSSPDGTCQLPGSFAAADDQSQASVFAAAVTAATDMPSKGRKLKVKRVAVTAVEVQLQACEVSFSDSMCASSAFATEAAKQAAAAGMQTQLLLHVSGVQLSVLPLSQQLGASLELLQVGYKAHCPLASAPSPVQAQQQSVELLLLRAVHFRQHKVPGLQLLKVAVQQLRSDNHIDAVLAGVAIASAVLQQGMSTVQQLQLRHASAYAAAASRQAAAAAVVAAATGELAAALEAAELAAAASATLDDQGLVRGDSFSALAVQPILDSLGNTEQTASAATGAGTAMQQLPTPAAGAALPPAAVRPGSSSGSVRAAVRQQKQKPLLALEAQLCDVAVQLSVCDNDALLVQMDQLNYSSVLEQAVITKLRFAINDRSIVQVPHAAVHNVPGWLPPGATATAAAAAAGQQPSSTSSGSGAGQAAGHASSNQGQGPWTAPAAVAPGVAYMQPAMGVSSSWQDLQTASSGAMTGLDFLDVPAPCSCLGSRRPAPETDPALYQRQAARQQAGRERCKVPAGPGQAAGRASGKADAGAAAGSESQGTAGSARGARSSISFSRSNEGPRGAGAEAGDSGSSTNAGGAVISLDVYAERVLFSVPHNEAPGRIIVVCETWAKAVKEVGGTLPACHVLPLHMLLANTIRLTFCVHAPCPTAGC